MSLFRNVERGNPDQHPLGNPPNAKFAKSEDIANAAVFRHAPGKIFLGLVNATVTGKPEDRAAMGGTPVWVGDNRHMLTIAGTRTGKGRGAIIPNILTYEGSVLATDPKGELATITARWRRDHMKQNVHVMDPFGVAKGQAVKSRRSFNPIRAMRNDFLVEDAALLADALVIPTEGSKDPHWDEAARSFIEGVILHVRTALDFQTGGEPTGTLLDVRRLTSKGTVNPLDGKFSLDALQTDMVKNRAQESENPQIKVAGEVIAYAASDFFDRPKNEKGSVLSTVRRHLKFLDYPGIADSLVEHDFDLEDLKRKKTTIYLCLPARHISTCARWLRMFVNLTLQVLEREPGQPVDDIPVLCCLDEFASLGRLKQVEEAAGQMAGFGVKLWPILQDLSQLQSLYDKRWETFMGNAGVIQFFGNNDLTTLKWISERCGKTHIRTSNERAQTAGASQEGAASTEWKTEVHDLLQIDEAAKLFGRYDADLRQLIIWAGFSPIILQRAYYDQHDLFSGRADDRQTEI